MEKEIKGLQETDKVLKRNKGSMVIEVATKSGSAVYTHYTDFAVMAKAISEERVLRDVNRQTRTDAVNASNRKASPLALLKQKARIAIESGDEETIQKINEGLVALEFQGDIYDLSGMKRPA